MKVIGWFLVITSLVLFKTIDAYAQYNETIRADRPGAAITPFAVGARVLQFQTGFFYAEASVNGDYPSTAYEGGGDVYIRYGLTENFEINTAFGLAGGKSHSDSTMEQFSGLNVLSIGFRYNIYTGQGWVPSVGVQTSLGLPWLHSYYNSNYVRPSVTVTASMNMTSSLTLTPILGLVWNGNSANVISYYVVNISFAATNKLSLFIEPYGYVDAGTWKPYFNAGAGFLVNNDLQLDLYGGYGTGPEEFSSWLISTGISWRVHFSEKKN